MKRGNVEQLTKFLPAAGYRMFAKQIPWAAAAAEQTPSTPNGQEIIQIT